MEREKALELMMTYIKAPNLRQHCLATEAIMRSLANRFGKDEQLWGNWGLLHDLDFESTKDAPDKHGLGTAEILRELNYPEEYIKIILSHNYEGLGGEPRSTLEEYALACAETVTGIITAAVLVRPDKNIAELKPKSVKKKMKDKAFARSVNRDVIKECEQIDIELSEFLQLSIDAMKTIAEELDLQGI